MVKNLKQEHISSETRISMVKNLTQNSTHCTELILNCTHGAELHKEDKKQDIEKWIFCILSEKEQYTTETIHYSAIIKMNRRISMQMITPVSTQHYDSHLENNDGKWDDNIKT